MQPTISLRPRRPPRPGLRKRQVPRARRLSRWGIPLLTEHALRLGCCIDTCEEIERRKRRRETDHGFCCPPLKPRKSPKKRPTGRDNRPRRPLPLPLRPRRLPPPLPAPTLQHATRRARAPLRLPLGARARRGGSSHAGCEC